MTGKPLSITGEISEYLAAKLLGLELGEARAPGFDAIDTAGQWIQIKARCPPAGARLTRQRLGSNRLEPEWDCVILILLDEQFEPQAIYEAARSPLEAALTKPGSKARSERGAKFISIGRNVRPADDAAAPRTPARREPPL